MVLRFAVVKLLYQKTNTLIIFFLILKIYYKWKNKFYEQTSLYNFCFRFRFILFKH